MHHAAADGAEGSATVGGLHERHVVHIDDVGVLGISVDLGVVPGALAERAIAGEPLPASAPVVRAEDAARVGFNDRPDSIRVRCRDGDADVAPDAGGQTRIARQLRPVIAAIRRLEQSAARSPRREQPGLSSRLPQTGVEHVRIVRVHHQINDAGGIVAKENLLPGFSAVVRPKDAALGIGRPDVAERGNVDAVGVRGVDHDVGDLTRGAESEEAPRLAAVGRLPHPVAVRDVAANRILAAAHIHDVRRGRRDGDRADGAAEILVAHRRPRLSGVDRLEHAAAGGAEPELIGSRRISRHGHRSAAAIRTDLAPAQRAEGERVEGRGHLGSEDRRREQERADREPAMRVGRTHGATSESGMR